MWKSTDDFQDYFTIICSKSDSTGLYAFINAWNEFMFGYIFISTDKYRTLTPAIMLFKGANTIDWGGLMAGSVIAVIPVLSFSCSCRKFPCRLNEWFCQRLMQIENKFREESIGETS